MQVSESSSSHPVAMPKLLFYGRSPCSLDKFKLLLLSSQKFAMVRSKVNPLCPIFIIIILRVVVSSKSEAEAEATTFPLSRVGACRVPTITSASYSTINSSNIHPERVALHHSSPYSNPLLTRSSWLSSWTLQFVIPVKLDVVAELALKVLPLTLALRLYSASFVLSMVSHISGRMAK